MKLVKWCRKPKNLRCMDYDKLLTMPEREESYHVMCEDCPYYAPV